MSAMADYDSDSSLDDAPYSETNVLLGYATTDPTDDAISHLGGTPVRPHPAAENTPD
jgi:pre-rRNA-processing protein TSR4